MNQNLPKRKPNRLYNYDYNGQGAYFVTLCTKGRKNILSSVKKNSNSPYTEDNYFYVELSDIGKIVCESINNIPKKYPAIGVDSYIIMPDHIHLILNIHSDPNGRPMSPSKINTVINQLKGIVSKHAGYSIWQKSFFDHIIRNRDDYEETIKYIHENPMRWYHKNNNN